MSVVDMIPRISYDPAALFSSQARASFGSWFSKMGELSKRARYELGEKLGGRLAKHMFYIVSDDVRNKRQQIPRSARDVICLQPKSVTLWNLLVSEARQAMRELILTTSQLSAELTFSWPLTVEGFRVHLEVPVLSAEIALAVDCRRNILEVRNSVLASLASHGQARLEKLLSRERFLEHARRFVLFGESLLSLTVKIMDA